MTTSPPPKLLQFNGKNIQFMAETGIIEKVSKRVESQLNASASGGGVQYYGRTAVASPTRLNVSSSNTTVTEIWLRDGDKELDHTLRTDLSVRETQKISLIMVANESERSRHYVGMINHTTGNWQNLNSLDYLVHATMISKLSTIAYFFMGLVAFGLWPMFDTWIPTVLALGGIIYMANSHSKKVSDAKIAFDNHVAEVKNWLITNKT